MPAPVIVIEITHERPAPEHLPTLVEACNRSAMGAECVLSVSADVRPDAVAIVHWEENSDEVRIEVGVRRGDDNDWRVRELSFKENDELPERWRAVGFAIGTLASRDRREQEVRKEVEAEKKTAPPEPLPAPKVEKPQAPVSRFAADRRPSEVWLELGPLTGPGIEGGAWRIGALLAGNFAPASSPLFITVTTRGALAPDQAMGLELDSRFLDVGAGLGYRLLRSERAGVALGAQAITEYLSVTASANDREEAQSRFLFGGRAIVQGHLMFTRQIGAYLAAHAAWLSGSTEIRLRSVSQGTLPELRYDFSAGLRLRLR